MGMLIIASIVGIIVLVVSIVNFKEEMDSWFGIGEILISIMFGGVGFVLTIIVAFLISLFFDTEYSETPSSTIQITALKDNSNIEGSFFLGSGTVDENQKYYYMEETHKRKQMKDVDANEHVYIKEGNIDQPKLEIYKEEFTSKFAIFMFGKEAGYDEYIFHIPEGSVTTEFDINME